MVVTAVEATTVAMEAEVADTEMDAAAKAVPLEAAFKNLFLKDDHFVLKIDKERIISACTLNLVASDCCFFVVVFLVRCLPILVMYRVK